MVRSDMILDRILQMEQQSELILTCDTLFQNHDEIIMKVEFKEHFAKPP
jgi:hypothetical protein